MIGFYNYTVILTYMSLLSALFGTFLAFNGNIKAALICLCLCGTCDAFDGVVARSKKDRTEEEKKFIERVEKSVGVTFDLQNAKLYEPVGCKYCNDVGYYERVALFEVLCLDDNLKDMISEGKSTIDIRNYAINNTEYKPLVVDGVNKVLEGITTIEELKNKITL